LREQPVRDEVVRQPNELIVQERGRLRGRAAIARFSTQSFGDFDAAIFERAAQDFRGLGVERLASAQGGEPVAQRAAVDDQRAMIVLADGHERRSAASSFRRYNSSSASRGVRRSGSMASSAE